jgi:hypothetical protein
MTDVGRRTEQENTSRELLRKYFNNSLAFFRELKSEEEIELPTDKSQRNATVDKPCGIPSPSPSGAPAPPQ